MIIEFNRKVLLGFHLILKNGDTVFDHFNINKIVDEEYVFRPAIRNLGLDIGTPIWINIWNPIHQIVKSRLNI